MAWPCIDVIELIPGNCHGLNRRVFAKSDEVNSIYHPDLVQIWLFHFRLLILVIRDRDAQGRQFWFCRGWVASPVTCNYLSRLVWVYTGCLVSLAVTGVA